MSKSEPYIPQRISLGKELRSLRLAKGLSGARLAARCSMSQTKISRLETGKIRPTILEVERIFNALEVPAEIAAELLGLAKTANIEYTSFRKYARTGLWRRQVEHQKAAEQSKVIREFLPAMPSGLLQIADYAAQTMSGGPAAVQARLERQAVLDDERRRFIFLLTEQAVRWRRAAPQVMADQLRHIVRQTERPNIDVAVVPESVTVNNGPLVTFFLFDDRLAIVELFSGEITFRGPEEVADHRRIFDFFYAHATTGSDAKNFLLDLAEEFVREV